MASLNDIKSWFKTGKFPTENQFSQVWESFWHKAEKISLSAISNLEHILTLKADRDLVDRQMNDLRKNKENVGVARDLMDEHAGAADAHQNLFDLKANEADVYDREELDDRFRSHRENLGLHWEEGEREARMAAVDTKLDLKVDKVEGKQLSTQDYTTEEKNKLGRMGEVAKALNVVYAAQSDDQKVYLKYVKQDLEAATEEVQLSAFPVVNSTHQGLMTPVDKGILEGLSVAGESMATWGTPSPIWKVGGRNGVMLKKSGEVLEVRDFSDVKYADLALNNITIKGNIVQEGSSFISNAETVETADNLILLNKGEKGAGVTKGDAGLEIDRGNEENYLILFDESEDRFKAGKAGDLHPVALRDDDSALADQHLIRWDAATKTFKDAGAMPALKGGSATETGKYVSGVTVSGHDVTVMKANLPVTLKNPSALTFTGAVTGSYDGAVAKTIHIPTIPANHITGSGITGCLAQFTGTHTVGTGPALGSSTTTYLRNDGTWAAPLNTTYSPFTRMVNGLVPAPAGSTSTRYLREDGMWAEVAGKMTKTEMVSTLNEAGDVTMTQHWAFAGGVANTSDMRFKKNVEPVGGVLDKICDMSVFKYNWEDETGNLGKKCIGISAQEMEGRFAEVVGVMKDERKTKTVDLQSEIAILFAAVKELYQKIKD